jgi:hypothetical protein
LVQSGDSDVSQSLEELSKCNQHLIIFYERNTSQHIVKCRGKNLIGSISVLFPALRYVCEQSYKTCEDKQVVSQPAFITITSFWQGKDYSSRDQC